MQLHITFSAPGLCLPVAYRHFVQSMLYDVLAVDPAYSARLHDVGSPAQGRAFKLFTFGQLEGSYTVRDKQIFFDGGVSLEVRSVHDELILRLLKGLSVGRQVRLGNSALTVAACTVTYDTVTADSLTVQTLSPIVAYITLQDGKTRFYSPEEPGFYSLICANARRKWQNLYGDAPMVFSIAPVESAMFRKQVTRFKSTCLTAWGGQFRLSGDPAVLQMLYDTGLGAKNSQGFGMFRVLK